MTSMSEWLEWAAHMRSPFYTFIPPWLPILIGQTAWATLSNAFKYKTECSPKCGFFNCLRVCVCVFVCVPERGADYKHAHARTKRTQSQA